MPPDPEDFGERAATEDEVADWVTLVRAGRAASKGWRKPKTPRHDRMRPIWGGSKASSEA